MCKITFYGHIVGIFLQLQENNNMQREKAVLTWRTVWVDKQSDLVEWVEKVRDEAVLSIDTETAGWQINQEKLCLIQIGNPTTKEIALIDALAIDDLSPIAPILTASQPRLVAHNAAFEVRQFERHRITLGGISDTLKMARRLRPDLPRYTLKSCVKYILGIEMSKEEQTSNWEQRPLTSSQIVYAALDVELTYYLFRALYEMEQKLVIDEKASIEDLMKQLKETVDYKWKLIEDIASELALAQARENILKEAIRNKLIAGEPPYSGRWGSCNIDKIKKTVVSVDKVRQLFPQIAPLVIKESIDRKELKVYMEEYGIEPRRLDEVLDTVGYTDRLRLSIAED